jgi:hypothetical protein
MYSELKDDRNDIGHVEVVRWLKISSKNILLFGLRWNNNTNFIQKFHDFGASGPGVKPDIFSEDLTEVDYFKTMLPCHIVDILTIDTSR